MKTNSVQNSAKPYLAIGLVILWLVFSGPINLFAHSGATLGALTKVSGSIIINGTIDSLATETVWAPGVAVDTLPNSCGEFIGIPPAPPVTLFALNDGINLYMAFDIPDSSANANDALFLFFDPNHGGGAAPAADDRAFRLQFNNVAANNTVPSAQHFTGTGAAWSAPIAGLPAGVEAKYTRHAAGSGKWQVELKFPFTGPTVGFAFVYLNETGAAVGDCDGDGQDDDFYATFPTLTLPANTNLPADVANPALWGNLDFGPQPPTVGFEAPLCCQSADITFVPSGQPFTANVPVQITARVHNLHATSVANNVNVEIRVHNFGTGGGVVSPPFPILTSIAAINAMNTATGSVNWPAPPAGIHGCIRAEIKPPTLSQYFISGGNGTAQHNIDVACIPQGGKKNLAFVTFNPEPNADVRIRLAQQVLLPRGFEGLRFELQQPDRPLRPQEEMQVALEVTAAANAPITQLPTQKAQVAPSAGGTAVPPLIERTGTAPVSVAVNSGDRLHLTASGEVDIDGSGPLSASGPDGKDVSGSARERRMLLGSEGASRFGGALIGSFDGFKTSFIVGAEATVTVPEDAKYLLLAVNDFDQGFGDNTGAGFQITVATLSTGGTAVGAARPDGAPQAGALAAAVTLPQINIAATSASRVNVGDNITYNLLNNYGGITYELLVIEGQGSTHGGGDGGGTSPAASKIVYILLILLVLVLLVFVVRRMTRKSKA